MLASVSAEMARVLFLVAVGLADGTLQIGNGSGIAILGIAREQAETLPKITAPPVLFLDAVGGSVWTLRIASGNVTFTWKT